MRIVMYSGGVPEDNQELDTELVHLLGTAKPRITFIPSCYEDSEELFDEFVTRYSEYGMRNFNMFHADRPQSRYDISRALDTDLVFLSGGNTFYFLYWMRKNKLVKLLYRYARDDGVLAGESAGAIMMTPNIRTAGFPEFDRDANNVGIINLKSLSLLKFEFFPHYIDRHGYRDALEAYSEANRRYLYAAGDGSGLVIQDEQIHIIGDVWGFFDGKKILLSPPFAA